MQFYDSDSSSDNETPVKHFLNYKIKDYYREPYLVLWCSDEQKITVPLDDLIEYQIRKATITMENDFKTDKFKLERMIKIKENELNIEKDKKTKQKNFKRVFRDYIKVNIWEHLPKAKDLVELPEIEDDMVESTLSKNVNNKTDIKYKRRCFFPKEKKNVTTLPTNIHNDVDLTIHNMSDNEVNNISQTPIESEQNPELSQDSRESDIIDSTQQLNSFPKEYQNITWFKIKIDTPIQLYLLKINADLTNFQYSEETFLTLPVTTRRSVFQLLSEICAFIGRSNNMAVLNNMSRQMCEQKETIIQSKHKFYTKFQETYMKVLEYTFDELSLETPQTMNLLLSFQSSIVTTKYSKRFTVSNILTFVNQQMKLKSKALKSILRYEKEKQQELDYDQFNDFYDD